MNGFNVLLVRTFFNENIPEVLLEAARIDGAGEISIFRNVVLPISKPILATIGLLVELAIGMTGIMDCCLLRMLIIIPYKIFK